MRVTVTNRLDTVPEAEWNRLAGAQNPFVSHQFLSALEHSGCLGDASGWWPQHLLVHEGEKLIGAAPMYLKDNSYGEFVFDWSWADAYTRAGLPYYPKLVVAVPFSPVPGPRILVEPGADGAAIAEVLAHAAIECARAHRASSVHWLFTQARDASRLQEQGLLLRTGCQFHWHNPGYADFGDFLGRLTSKKRKQIRHERRDAAASGLAIEMLTGREAGTAQWEAYHRLYCSTFDRKWGRPSLTVEFFEEIGRTLPDATLLVLARHGRRYVAGAFFMRGSDTLFGRHWGCSEYHPALHFELCYYRGIEYCISQGLQRFEAGAQGEHKLSRGFLPIATNSAHWIRHRGFRRAIDEFLVHERAAVERYMAEASDHLPYRAEETCPHRGETPRVPATP